MSHPEDISCRWQRTISRKRLRMRLRTTEPPSAFLMLKPKRLNGSSLARRKTVKWELERRFPARYTASNSSRRTRRRLRGNLWPVATGRCDGPSALLRCKTMTALLAARCKHFAATLGLHTRTKPVRFGAAALSRLKCTLWQSNPPYGLATVCELPKFHPPAASAACSHCGPGWPWSRVHQTGLPALRQLSEFTSVLATRSGGQESCVLSYREGKSDTPQGAAPFRCN
jgi:hypothetical protein